MTANLDPKDAKAGLRAMESYALDQPRKRLSVMIVVR